MKSLPMAAVSDALPRILALPLPAERWSCCRAQTQILSQKISKHVGKHSLKFGAQYSQHCCQRANVEAVGWTYTGLADLLAGIPSNINISFGQGEYKAIMSEWGMFVQDDWRVHPRLTLNLDLSYDFFGNMLAKPTDQAAKR